MIYNDELCKGEFILFFQRELLNIFINNLSIYFFGGFALFKFLELNVNFFN